MTSGGNRDGLGCLQEALGTAVFIDVIFSSSQWARQEQLLPHCTDERLSLRAVRAPRSQTAWWHVALYGALPSCVPCSRRRPHTQSWSLRSQPLGALGSLLPPLPFHRQRQGTALHQRFLPAWPSSPNLRTMSSTPHTQLHLPNAFDSFFLDRADSPSRAL